MIQSGKNLISIPIFLSLWNSRCLSSTGCFNRRKKEEGERMYFDANPFLNQRESRSWLRNFRRNNILNCLLLLLLRLPRFTCEYESADRISLSSSVYHRSVYGVSTVWSKADTRVIIIKGPHCRTKRVSYASQWVNATRTL